MKQVKIQKHFKQIDKQIGFFEHDFLGLVKVDRFDKKHGFEESAFLTKFLKTLNKNLRKILYSKSFNYIKPISYGCA